MANRLTRGQGLIGKVVANNGFTVGNGTNVKKIEVGSVSASWASIDNGETASAEFTLTGAAAGDVVLISGADTFSSASVSLSHAGAATDKGVIWALNAGAASVTASAALQYTWIDVT
jgi:hypothetical protein